MAINHTPEYVVETHVIDEFELRDFRCEVVRIEFSDQVLYGISIYSYPEDHDDDPRPPIDLTWREVSRLETAFERMRHTIDADRSCRRGGDEPRYIDVCEKLAGPDGDADAIRRQLRAGYEAFVHGGVPGWSPCETDDEPA